MIRFGLRLALSGGRGAAIGLALTAFAVAVGTAILLFALSFDPALNERARHAAWRQSYIPTETGTSEGAAMLIRSDVDSYQGEPIVRVLVGALTANPPTPPGVDRLPGTGQAVVSPALAALMQTVPADQLGDRVGAVVGTIGDAGLRSPDELVAIIGVDPATLDGLGAAPIVGFDSTPRAPEIPPIAILMIVLAIIGALVPVAVFVSTATRLSAARREQRLAALRLVGATAAQVRWLAAVEALFVTIVGVVAGIGLFFLVRPLVAMIPLDATTWFAGSIVPPALPAIGLLLVIPVVGVAAAVVALRRVVMTPLGVQRRQTPGMPGARRAVPLIAALAALPFAIGYLRGDSSNYLALGLVGAAFGGVIVGIVLVGPWLTYLVGRALHALPGGASMLLASRRLTDDPRASFGAIAGVIMAVFVASAFFSFVAYADNQQFDRAGVLAADQVFVEMPYNEGPPFAEVPATIAAVPGVRSVLPIATAEVLEGGPLTVWVAPCVDVARQFGLVAGSCGQAKLHAIAGSGLEPGTYTLSPDRGNRLPIMLTVGAGDVATFTPPAGPIASRLPQLIVEPGALPAGRLPSPTRFYVTTNGSPATGEQLRTAVLASVPTGYVRLASESRATSRVYAEFGRVVGLGLIGTLVLAGCSLAVAVTTNVLDRRRQFALLRSAGMPVGRLRALVLLQAGAPLLAVAAFSALLGIVVAQLILRLATRGEVEVPWPDPSLGLTLGASVLGALIVVALMLPPLERLTRPETARAE
ncbi:MAG: FtsX-like permease family protein [Chloroflexota bacterium]